MLTEHEVFKTDFFEMFFIKKANGYVLIDYRKINLKDGMVLIVKPSHTSSRSGFYGN